MGPTPKSLTLRSHQHNTQTLTQHTDTQLAGVTLSRSYVSVFTEVFGGKLTKAASDHDADAARRAAQRRKYNKAQYELKQAELSADARDKYRECHIDGQGARSSRPPVWRSSNEGASWHWH